MEERMSLFLDNMEETAANDVETNDEIISDEEVDMLIVGAAKAELQQELDRVASLRAELGSLTDGGEKTATK